MLALGKGWVLWGGQAAEPELRPPPERSMAPELCD